MAKIFKISGYLVDYLGWFGNEIEQFLLGELEQSFDVIPQHIHVEKSEDFEWSEELPISKENCDLAYCEQYFNTKPMPVDVNRQLPETGDVWRHFKTGKEIEVLYVAQSTENLGEFNVIYKFGDSDKVWSRPLWMFMSRTDKAKYPDATQDWRFELVSRKGE